MGIYALILPHFDPPTDDMWEAFTNLETSADESYEVLGLGGWDRRMDRWVDELTNGQMDRKSFKLITPIEN